MSRQLFVVNDVHDVKPSQSTGQWMIRTAARGHEVVVVGVGGLDVSDDRRILAHGRRLDVDRALAADDDTPLSEVLVGDPVVLDTVDVDAVVLRTNPARDARGWAHDAVLQVLSQAEEQGALVLSRPSGLARARSKLYLSTFPPHTRPPTLVSHDPARLRAFLDGLGGRGVVKPLVGTRGQDVFMVDPAGRTNLSQILDVVTRDGFAMAQGFVPEAQEGDIRLLLVDGRLLERDGHVAAVRRVPGGDDFRSNVAVGGTPAAATITPALRKLVDDVGPRLRADGLFLVGLDVIGDRIVECNVFSAGGFADAHRFTGVDFLDAILDEVEQQIARHRPEAG